MIEKGGLDGSKNLLEKRSGGRLEAPKLPFLLRPLKCSIERGIAPIAGRHWPAPASPCQSVAVPELLPVARSPLRSPRLRF